MFNKIHNVLTSRLASTMLVAVLFAGLTAPFVIVQSMHAFAATLPLECTEGNHNGCTELSSTPPEDLQTVPPNLVLMLDDSGSMSYDYMPDWGYLSNTGQWGVRNASINGVYYNPATVYTPPPKADGTLYADSPGLTNAYFDGFTDTVTRKDVRSYIATDAADFGHQYRFGNSLQTTVSNTSDVDKGPAIWGGGTPYIPGSPGSPAVPAACPTGYVFDPADSSRCIRDPVPTSGDIWRCNSGDGSPTSHGGKTNQCRHRVRTESGNVDTWYDATNAGPRCPSGATYNASDNLCHYPAVAPTPAKPATDPTDPIAATPDYMWVCPSGSKADPAAPAPPSDPPRCVAHTDTPLYVWAFVYVVGTPVSANAHVVVPNGSDAPAGGWCSVLVDAWAKKYCVSENDISGAAAPITTPDGQPALAQSGTPLTAGQNIANWFSYYRTRMLMAKSGLMGALSELDPNYRFGFASINGNGKGWISGPAYSGSKYVPPSPLSAVPFVTFDDSYTYGGDSSNRLAVVQPYGAGADSKSQKAKFWTWLANQSPNNGTPLRKALAAVGEYYQSSQPWQTMPGDPGYTTGSTTQFTCRASYTILTTDGFWNGDPPSGIGSAAGNPGPVNTVPAGNITQYTAQPPFSGGAVSDSEPSLADVATYYWARDLQPSLANEVSAGKTDPAAWQHMSTFTIGLGFTPAGIQPAGTTMPQIFGWSAGGAPVAGFKWPTPASGSLNNIADLAHAAVNGHGGFFSVTNPAELATAFAKTLTDIASRNVAPKPVAVNASVLALGAAAFRTGYQTGDWSGQFQSVALKTDGTVSQILWKADALLDAAYHSPTGYTSRTAYTGAYNAAAGTYSPFMLTAASSASLDAVESAGLNSPASAGAGDTLVNRVRYLLGDNTFEGAPFRSRTSILGAILHADPVYVAGATGNYRNSWPTIATIAPPEGASGAQLFSTFVQEQTTQSPMVYMGANDGMLHAFHAPVPKCTGTVDASGNCSAYTFPTGSKQGEEAWAFVPRAVYANLGNLTRATNFHFRPTVDGTPEKRDVFSATSKKWRTLLAGGVGVGGRGVYALDITNPDPTDADASKRFSKSNVLWEFDSDMAIAGTCVASYGSCKGTDLGYTVSQPNIGRLSNGQWVVLVPNGYFPDCKTPDYPTADTPSCDVIAAQAPKDSGGKPYSALFVLDAETGKVIAELKTPSVSGVTSFGLAKPVLGDYNSDQVDDVAFAGDVQGNLWRFDLSDTDPAKWAVTLTYKGTSKSGQQGVQPITTMPRLFPDPATNRFIVLFGTGKYLGVGDNSRDDEQAIYGVRDVAGATYSQGDLTQQFLHEFTAPVGSPSAGASLRCVTGSAADGCTSSATAINSISAGAGGWFINLSTTDSAGVRNDAGERVVVNPGAIFASNTVIFESLITGSQTTDACNPTTQGAILALNAATGGSAGVSSLGGVYTAGGRTTGARTSGSLPVVSALGGGKAYLPGSIITPSNAPMSIDVPIWRRRSWRVLNSDQ